jgi:catechol-2,3-dioxygenase
MKIEKIKLLTDQLEKLKRFYSVILGLPLLNDSGANEFTVRAGRSYVTFENSGNLGASPYYHFAFDIPGNHIDSSIQWLQSRGIALNTLPNQSTKAYSKSWNATSIYFYDPAHNIVEFIARHTLDNATMAPFSSGSLLGISEIGLVAHDVPFVRQLLMSHLNLVGYKESYPKFAAIGDEEGLLILSEFQRVWLGSDKEAAVFNTEITIKGAQKGSMCIEPYPYRIIIE